MTTLPASVPVPQVERARALLDRCEAAWPHRRPNGAASAVIDYLREGMANHEWLVDACENAEVALGDRCTECGDPIGDDGDGSARCCSRECEHANGGEF